MYVSTLIYQKRSNIYLKYTCCPRMQQVVEMWPPLLFPEYIRLSLRFSIVICSFGENKELERLRYGCEVLDFLCDVVLVAGPFTGEEAESAELHGPSWGIKLI